MLKRAQRFLTLFSVVLLNTACVSTMGKMQKLDDALWAYEGAIRWNEFEAANDFGADEKPRLDSATLGSIKVTDYEIKSRRVSKEDLEAKQTVVVTYYVLSDMRQRTTVHNQQWTYNEDQKRWEVQPGLPEF